jgi:tripartite-type tricarboxylate transporter receptor subunit TctC
MRRRELLTATVGTWLARLSGVPLAMRATASQAQAAAADDWHPGRSVELWISYPPGGGGDAIARMLTQTLAERRHWTVAALNRPGAGGSLMLKSLAGAKPDGLTVGLCLSNQLTYTPIELGQPPFASDSFTWIAGLARSPFALVASAQSGLATLADVAALGAKRPVLVGVTSSMAWVPKRMSEAMNREFTAVPFKGGAELVQNTLAGHVDLCVNAGGHLALERAGRVVVVASLLPERLPTSPNAGTMREQGVDIEIDSRFALLAPPGLPATVAQAWSRAVGDLFTSSDLAQRIETGLGLIPAWQDGDRIRDSIAREISIARHNTR